MARVASIRGAADAMLEAADKMAKKLAPGVIMVSVGPKTWSLA